jgi:hypothetical protein
MSSFHCQTTPTQTWNLVEIEDGPSNLCKPPSTPKLEEMEEELDDLQMKQNLPTPVVINMWMWSAWGRGVRVDGVTLVGVF